MKKYLIPETGSFYKANLHCHTTISDGSMTPEEVKEHYKAAGYTENCAKSTLKTRKHRQTDCPQGNIHSRAKGCELAAQNTTAYITP